MNSEAAVSEALPELKELLWSFFSNKSYLLSSSIFDTEERKYCLWVDLGKLNKAVMTASQPWLRTGLMQVFRVQRCFKILIYVLCFANEQSPHSLQMISSDHCCVWNVCHMFETAFKGTNDQCFQSAPWNRLLADESLNEEKNIYRTYYNVSA